MHPIFGNRNAIWAISERCDPEDRRSLSLCLPSLHKFVVTHSPHNLTFGVFEDDNQEEITRCYRVINDVSVDELYFYNQALHKTDDSRLLENLPLSLRVARICGFVDWEKVISELTEMWWSLSEEQQKVAFPAFDVKIRRIRWGNPALFFTLPSSYQRLVPLAPKWVESLDQHQLGILWKSYVSFDNQNGMALVESVCRKKECELKKPELLKELLLYTIKHEFDDRLIERILQMMKQMGISLEGIPVLQKALWRDNNKKFMQVCIEQQATKMSFDPNCYSSLELIQLFLDHGATVTTRNKKGKSPAQCFVDRRSFYDKDQRIMKVLGDKGDTAVIDSDFYLSRGIFQRDYSHAKRGLVEELKAHKENGADFATWRLEGDTPLHMLYKAYSQPDCWEDPEASLVLLEAGVDVLVRDSKGRTPFEYLIDKLWGKQDTVKVVSFHIRFRSVIKKYISAGESMTPPKNKDSWGDFVDQQEKALWIACIVGDFAFIKEKLQARSYTSLWILPLTEDVEIARHIFGCIEDDREVLHGFSWGHVLSLTTHPEIFNMILNRLDQGKVIDPDLINNLVVLHDEGRIDTERLMSFIMRVPVIVKENKYSDTFLEVIVSSRLGFRVLLRLLESQPGWFSDLKFFVKLYDTLLTLEDPVIQGECLAVCEALLKRFSQKRQEIDLLVGPQVIFNEGNFCKVIEGSQALQQHIFVNYLTPELLRTTEPKKGTYSVKDFPSGVHLLAYYLGKYEFSQNLWDFIKTVLDRCDAAFEFNIQPVNKFADALNYFNSYTKLNLNLVRQIFDFLWEKSGRVPTSFLCYLARVNAPAVHFVELVERGHFLGIIDGRSTPLEVACSEGHASVVKTLMELGADPISSEDIVKRSYNFALHSHFYGSLSCQPRREPTKEVSNDSADDSF